MVERDLRAARLTAAIAKMRQINIRYCGSLEIGIQMKFIEYYEKF